WQNQGRNEELTAAHRAAAAYWRWRSETWPQDRRSDIHDLIEARHHLIEAGDFEEAGGLTEGVCLQLDTWGAWEREDALSRDALTWLPDSSPRRTAHIHHLGMLAQDRGDYEEAERRYRESLEINERLGDQSGMASSYHQLGILARRPRRLRGAIASHPQAPGIRLRLRV